MSINKAQKQEHQDLPLVLAYRPPSFDFSLRHNLESPFHLLDPLYFPRVPTRTFLVQKAHPMRAWLCVDPTPISKDLLSLLPSLQIIVGSNVGVDHIDLTECQLRGICVTDAGSAFCEDVADYAVGLLIDVLRRVSAPDRLFRLGCGLLLLFTRLVVMS